MWKTTTLSRCASAVWFRIPFWFHNRLRFRNRLCFRHMALTALEHHGGFMGAMFALREHVRITETCSPSERMFSFWKHVRILDTCSHQPKLVQLRGPQHTKELVSILTYLVIYIDDAMRRQTRIWSLAGCD